MNTIFSIAGAAGLTSLLARFSANLTTDLTGSDTALSQSLSELVGRGVGSLSQSALRGQTTPRELIMALSRAEQRPVGQILELERTSGAEPAPVSGTQPQNNPAPASRYYQTRSQMLAALLHALQQGQRNC